MDKIIVGKGANEKLWSIIAEVIYNPPKIVSCDSIEEAIILSEDDSIDVIIVNEK